MSNTSFTLDFPQITNKQVIAYILKEGESGNLQSKSSRLNGAPLSWSTHQPGPNMRGNATSLPLTIPDYSQFFIIVNRTQSEIICIVFFSTFRRSMSEWLVQRNDYT